MKLLPHPATLRLLRFQAAGKFLRTVRRFRQPRRLILSLLAMILAVAWIGQTGMAVLFREAADPEKLRVWIPLSLLGYSLWHVLKTACRAPLEPFEWTPAERELLGGAPLRREELVKYRLTSIGLASVAKAACFALVMLPDLHVWIAGFLGMFLALIFVDLIRMACEICVYGLSGREFIRFRIAVLVIAGAALTGALVSALCLPGPLGMSRPVALDIGLRFLVSLADLRTTWVGITLEAPFWPFASLMLAERISWTLLGFLMLGSMMTLAGIHVIMWLDRFFHDRRIAGERARCRQLQQSTPQECGPDKLWRRAMRIPVRLRGAGGLAWRQALGALRYRTSIVISLTVPAVLCCLTLVRPQPALATLIQVIGGLVFYSFLLLPTALKFDFRRDLDRLTVIKSLPISAAATTLGQLTTPVLLATFFQIVVLTVTMIVRPFHPLWYVAAITALVPINVFIFSLENLIFMLYPYRQNQEGVGVFLRSILTFTAKGILFASALGLTLVWGFASQRVGTLLFPGHLATAVTILFTTGVWLLCTLAAVGTTMLLVRVYHRFDASEDLPALS